MTPRSNFGQGHRAPYSSWVTTSSRAILGAGLKAKYPIASAMTAATKISRGLLNRCPPRPRRFASQHCPHELGHQLSADSGPVRVISYALAYGVADNPW